MRGLETYMPRYLFRLGEPLFTRGMAGHSLIQLPRREEGKQVTCDDDAAVVVAVDAVVAVWSGNREGGVQKSSVE